MRWPMAIKQGEVFWIEADVLDPAVPGASHPHVVLQSDELNDSRIATTVVCAVTTNANRANEPGNVRLAPGEANLPHASIAVVSRVCTVNKRDLGDKLGELSAERLEQIFAGMRALHRSFPGR